MRPQQQNKQSPEHRRQYNERSPTRSRTSKPSPGRELHGQGIPPPHMMPRMVQPNDPQDPQEEGPTPICRCRVLYLGSSVPQVTKDGLQGIQEPLKELYPEDGALGAKGIDSWLSVWSNGFLLENVDENRKKVSRFFPIDSLHYCAAVRYVQVPGTSGEKVQRFLPLDSPFARNPNINHPPLFAAILRRTTGIKVLECHVFICKRETAANALVRCSFHAYADSTYAKHLENGASLYGTVGSPTPVPPMAGGTFHPQGENGAREFQQSVMEMSDDSINSVDQIAVQQNGNISPQSAPLRHDHVLPNGTSSPKENGTSGEGPDEISVFNGDDNHKVWAGKEPGVGDVTDGIYGDYGSTMRSFRSSASGVSTRNRPRQMMMQSPPPPPIPEEVVKEAKEEKKEKKKKKKSKSRDTVDGNDTMPPPANGSVPNGNGGLTSNGSVINMPTGRASSVSGGRKMSAGSFMGISSAPNGRPPVNGGGPPRGMPGPHQGMAGPPQGMSGPPQGMPGPPQGVPPQMMMMPPGGPRGKKAGTFSHRQKGGPRPIPPFMMYGPGPGPGMPPPPPQMIGMPPPHLMPPPGHPLYQGGPPFGHFPMAGGRPDSQHMEEPIYMPNAARPMSPVASYQPGHFPHDAYYSQQQYATIDKNGRHRGQSRPQKQKSKQSKHQSSDSNAEDSEYGGPAGIYKKGHINERAFAHSMRNEHRSRSYGSLANLQFDPNGEVNGPGGEQGSPELMGQDPKKEQEAMMMMDNMDLDEDRLERSEVPAGFYPPGPHPGPPHPMYRGHPGPGPMMGPGPPFMMNGPPVHGMPMMATGGRRRR